MSKTKTQVATEALEELRVVGEGQSASAEDQATAEAKLTTLLARLRYDNIWASQDDSEFEDEVADIVAYLLAEELAPKLGGRQRDMAAIDRYEGQLLRIQNQPLQRNTLYVDKGLRQTRRTGYWDFTTGT